MRRVDAPAPGSDVTALRVWGRWDVELAAQVRSRARRSGSRARSSSMTIGCP
jgi:hypothetical protein